MQMSSLCTNCWISARSRAIRASPVATGGEPLLRLDYVLECIRALKHEFGPEHHIHLYSASSGKSGSGEAEAGWS